MDDDHWYGFRNALSQRGDEWSASRIYGTAITILNANCSLVNMTHTLWTVLYCGKKERKEISSCTRDVWSLPCTGFFRVDVVIQQLIQTDGRGVIDRSNAGSQGS
jgi:hypothetical protein